MILRDYGSGQIQIDDYSKNNFVLNFLENNGVN